ncbi:TlpA disulfide reductase family protein [Deltaproteobacteria bacterium TL4]
MIHKITVTVILCLSCLWIFHSFAWATNPKQNPVQSKILSEPDRQFLLEQNIETAYSLIKAEDFKGVLAEGTPIELTQYRNQWVFLNFWATWCVPCLQELPDMEKLHQRFGNQGLVILAVGMGESQDKIKKFLENHALTFAIVTDKDLTISKAYGVENLPVTYLLTPEGFVYARAVGPRKWANTELMEYFRQKLKVINPPQGER